MSHETISLKLKARDVVGKRLRGLRTAGEVPAIIHDHGKDSVVVQAPYSAVQHVVQGAGKHHIVQLDIEGGKKYNALIKDVTYEPRKHQILHVVFNAVKANEQVDAEIPVHLQYAEGDEVTPAEQKGLIVIHNTEAVAIESLPKDLPDVLFAPADKLVEVGDQLTVADLIVPNGVVVKDEATTVLATVFEPSSLAAANDAAGGDAEDPADVEAENGGDTDQEAQAEETRPGGKGQDEPKQSNVDANK